MQELYQILFAYAVHLDESADKDEKKGKDRSYFRDTIRRESGLSKEQASLLLASARRYVSAELASQTPIHQRRLESNEGIDQHMSVANRDGLKRDLVTAKGLVTQARDNEIASIKMTLGTEDTGRLEAYLTSKFLHAKRTTPFGLLNTKA